MNKVSNKERSGIFEPDEETPQEKRKKYFQALLITISTLIALAIICKIMERLGI